MRRLCVESLPQFLVGEAVEDFADALCHAVEVEVSIGLQTVTEQCRAAVLASPFTNRIFEEAVRNLRRIGFQLRVHVLIPLPLLTAEESSVELSRTAEYLSACAPETISFCLLRPQPGTLVGEWYREGIVHDPWPALVREAYAFGTALVASGKIRRFKFDGLDSFTCGEEKLPWLLCSECLEETLQTAGGTASGALDLCGECTLRFHNRDQAILEFGQSPPERATKVTARRP